MRQGGIARIRASQETIRVLQRSAGCRCSRWLPLRAQQPGGATVRETGGDGGPCSAEDAGYNACNIKRVPGWELPEQNAIDPRRRTEHATVGWCSLTSKVVTFALPIRLALLLQACRARPTLAPGRAESPSFCESYSRLKNIVLSSPPLHLFIILSPLRSSTESLGSDVVLKIFGPIFPQNPPSPALSPPRPSLYE